jgi:hypothetical protein
MSITITSLTINGNDSSYSLNSGSNTFSMTGTFPIVVPTISASEITITTTYGGLPAGSSTIEEISVTSDALSGWFTFTPPDSAGPGRKRETAGLTVTIDDPDNPPAVTYPAVGTLSVSVPVEQTTK